MLSQTAPSTSKYLMSRCHALMFETGLDQPEAHKRKVCGSCGNIIYSSANDRITVDSKKARPRKSLHGKKTSTEARAVVFLCGCCGKETRHRLETAPPAIRKPIKSFNSTSSAASDQLPQSSNRIGVASTPPPTLSTNASSKKRAKARKQSGLGALLAKHKESESRANSGFGLDLLDLMKKT